MRDSRLEKTCREGAVMVELTLAEKKQVVLDILIHIDEICRRNNLTYFIAYGTLIGAVRHQGFIPWDDDIDIWVPISDYQRLLGILEKTDKYSLINNLKTNNWPRPFSKLTDERTIIVDTKDYNLHVSKGLAVDIFPLASSNSPEQKYKRIHEACRRMIWSYSAASGAYGVKGIKKFLTALLGHGLNCFGKNVKYWQNVVYEMECSESNGKYIAYFDSKYGMKDIVERSWFDDTIEIEFENHLFFAPKKYDKVLTSIYGDYMKLPPVEQQVSVHQEIAYWRES